MLVKSLMTKPSGVNEKMSVAECLAMAVDLAIDFLHLVNDKGQYTESIRAVELIDKKFSAQETTVIEKLNIQRYRLPVLEVDSLVDDVKIPDDIPPYYQCFVVIDKTDCYRGIVSFCDVMKRQLGRLQKQLSYFDRLHEYQQRGVVVLDKHAQVEYCNTTIAGLFNGHRLDDAAALPGATHVSAALINGSRTKELEVLVGTEKYLMDVVPVEGENGIDQVIATYCNTNSIRHFVILETMFGSMREGVNIVDENGILRYSNPSSARYANVARAEDMIGYPIQKFYSKAILTKVIQDRKSYTDQRVEYGGRVYVTNAVPLFVGGKFIGGIATFRDITEIMHLTKKLATMEGIINSMEFELSISKHSDVFNVLIGSKGSLRPVVEKSQRCIAALGGPRHCILAGETGTGKTALAQAMYYFAKRIGIIAENSPFIQVNCAQFTNPDIAAMEIFGSEKGAFTGAQDKKGLIELADNGILFLDEAHALGPHQIMLLKVIEEGMARRIGGRVEKKVSVIVIAASTQNLKTTLIPELYQRFAQYQIFLEPLRNRPVEEKKAMLDSFLKRYEESAKEHYGLNLTLSVTGEAEKQLLSASYPRNIRQFRDVVNTAIDAALPLVYSVRQEPGSVIGVVDIEHLPTELLEQTMSIPDFGREHNMLNEKILYLYKQGLGARKIAKSLAASGIEIEFYQVTYLLQKLKQNVRK